MKKKLLNFLSLATLLLFTSSMLGQTYNNEWDGSASTDWDTAANWTLGTVPVLTDNVRIVSAPANQPVISSGTLGRTAFFRVDSGATLTINSGGALTVDDDLSNFGTLTVNSSASDSGTLIVIAASSGNITYNRYVPGGGWYLLSAPVAGVTFVALFNNNGGTGTFQTGNAHSSTAGVNVAIAGYTGTAWSYMSSFIFGGPSMSAGAGVSVNLISSGSLTMTGALSGSTSRTLNTDAFTLLGNPYTASFNAINFLSTNTAKLTQETVWVRSGSGYTAYNDISPIKIAPGQGFFVRANSTAGNVAFSRSDVSHDAADTFGKSIPFATYELFVENNGVVKSTKVFYAENRTTGFDNGSDSSLFSDDDDFSIYTDLVEGSEGQKLEIQTLPDTNIESFVVPVGVTAAADSEIIFSIEASNFDENIKITLEDRLTNTFTRLDEANSTYKVITETDVDGVGRFYMHTTQDVLSVDTNEWSSTVQIYKVNNANVRITGLTQGEATVQMYNILGKQVLSTSFDVIGAKDIAIPNDISKGIYFVKLETADGILNKKIILE
jgi:hypothetical protein